MLWVCRFRSSTVSNRTPMVYVTRLALKLQEIFFPYTVRTLISASG